MPISGRCHRHTSHAAWWYSCQKWITLNAQQACRCNCPFPGRTGNRRACKHHHGIKSAKPIPWKRCRMCFWANIKEKKGRGNFIDYSQLKRPINHLQYVDFIQILIPINKVGGKKRDITGNWNLPTEDWKIVRN